MTKIIENFAWKLNVYINFNSNYPLELCFKKPWIVLNPLYTIFFLYVRTYDKVYFVK